MNVKIPFVVIALMSSCLSFAQMDFPEFDYKNFEVKTDLSKSVPKEIQKQIDVNKLLKGSLLNFQTMHMELDMIDFSASVFPINGRHANLRTFWEETSTMSEGFKSKLKALKTVFFGNKKSYGAIYDKCMPLYLEAFAKMTVPEQQGYLDLIQNGIEYVKNFDQVTEETDLKSMKGGFVYKKGSLNAFIFRRIISKELTQKEISYWLRRIHKELEAKKREVESLKDEYIIAQTPLFSNYHWAYKFGTRMNMTLLKKEKDNFTKLFLDGSTVLNLQKFAGHKTFTIEHLDGTRELAIINTEGNGKMERYPISGKVYSSNFNMNNGSFILYYNGKKTELFLNYLAKKGEPRQRYLLDNTNRKFYFPDPNYILTHYRDNTLEVLIIDPVTKKLIKKKKVDIPVTDIKIEREKVLYKYKKNNQREILMVVNNEVKRNKLYAGYDYLGFQKWNEYLIFETKTKTGNYYGVLAENGSMEIKPEHRKIIGLKDILLIQQSDDSKPYYAIFDKQLNRKTPFVYEFNDDSRPDFEDADGTIILYKNKYSNGTITKSNAVLLDYSGNEIIPLKYGIIKRLYVPNRSGESFYAVSKKITIKNGDKIGDAFAIYDNKGNALTKFDYSEVKNYLSPTEDAYDKSKPALIECVKKGKTVKVNTKGKEE